LADAVKLEELRQQRDAARVQRMLDHTQCEEFSTDRLIIDTSAHGFACVHIRHTCFWLPSRALKQELPDDGTF
jgi:hypothetical protein